MLFDWQRISRLSGALSFSFFTGSFPWRYAGISVFRKYILNISQGLSCLYFPFNLLHIFYHKTEGIACSYSLYSLSTYFVGNAFMQYSAFIWLNFTDAFDTFDHFHLENLSSFGYRNWPPVLSSTSGLVFLSLLYCVSSFPRPLVLEFLKAQSTTLFPLSRHSSLVFLSCLRTWLVFRI